MAERAKLSAAILDRMRQEAASAPRGARRLATLDRLEQACDDISSGRAKGLAGKADRDASRFGDKRPKINFETVELYIRIRQRLDVLAGNLESEWTGPVSVTIRSDKDLHAYVRARQAEALGLRKPRVAEARAARIDTILAEISKPADRMAVATALEEGYRHQARHQILVTALRQVPGLDLNAILRRGPSDRPPEAETIVPLGPGERIVLRRLISRWQDPRILAEFGLRHDGRPLMMAMPPGTQLVEKDELALLEALVGSGSAGQSE